MLSVFMFIEVCAEPCYTECHYAKCRYAECHYAKCHYYECRYAKCRGVIVVNFLGFP